MINRIIEKDKKQFSPALYDLTELQRDCNKLWGFSAKQTLSIMQRLYENHIARTGSAVRRSDYED